jgi:tagatose 1,6-diphosphate aldolase GatY/KbaY
MIDGSHFPLDENIAFTKKTAQLCGEAGIPVEGELGRVGGKEDDLEGEDGGYTDPEEAIRFVSETGITSLAVGIGTSHGIYTTPPILKPELISILKGVLPIPLVMHGSSGLRDEVIKDCIARGISKVNFATELRITYTNAVREYLAKNPACFDPKQYGDAAREAVKKLAVNLINICGSAGQA